MISKGNQGSDRPRLPIDAIRDERRGMLCQTGVEFNERGLSCRMALPPAELCSPGTLTGASQGGAVSKAEGAFVRSSCP